MNKKEFSIEPGIFWLYILKCENGYWYVGVTKNVKQRYKQHKKQSGANFTKKHKDVELYDYTKLGYMTYEEAEKCETATAFLWKKRFGKKKVSGGLYCQGYHDKTAKKFLGENSTTIEPPKRIPLQRKCKKPKRKRKIEKIKVNYVRPKLGVKTGEDGLKVKKC